MAGDAYNTIQKFWQIQNAGDYRKTVELFAENGVIEDPIYGRFEGIEAIGGFMAKMVEVIGGQNMRFELVQLSGDETTAWAQWKMIAPDREVNGCGVYKVSASRITYYRDYIDAPEQTSI
ncbi:MAG: nuclear transport factor 2 family protein [Pseudomonadota bacterium]